MRPQRAEQRGGAVPLVRKAVPPPRRAATVLAAARTRGWILPDPEDEVAEEWLEAQLSFVQRNNMAVDTRAMRDLIKATNDYLNARTYRNLPADLIEGAIASVRSGARTPASAAEYLWDRARMAGAAQWASSSSQLTERLSDSWRSSTRQYFTAMERNPTLRQWLKEQSGDADFGPIRVRFGTPNPRQLPAFQQQVKSMTLGLDRQTQRGIAAVIERGLREGRNPLDVAREVRAVSGFGLTEQQALAVANYRRQLVVGHWAEARSRGLHDQRFRKPPVTDEQILALTDRYAERMMAFRSRTIARTEMMRAVNQGAQAAWEDLVTEGIVEQADLLRYWITAPENASGAGAAWNAPSITGPCPLCAPIPGKNEAGRRMDEPFEYADGQIMMPPVHPNCRCGVFYRPRFLSFPERKARAAAMGLPPREPPAIELPPFPWGS